MPTPCRNCGTILEASYAAESGYCCPTCGEPVCWVCGCTETTACRVMQTTADGARSTTWPCWWIDEGLCSGCGSRAAYEFFMEATGRLADDPFYVSLGRPPRAVKGLGWGIGCDPAGLPCRP